MKVSFLFLFIFLTEKKNQGLEQSNVAVPMQQMLFPLKYEPVEQVDTSARRETSFPIGTSSTFTKIHMKKQIHTL